MPENICLNCQGRSFKEILHMEEFPILFGAVPGRRKDQVKKYPLTVAMCNGCFLVQQINLLPGSVLDEVYTSDYYSCPAPSTSPIGRRVIHEFLDFFHQAAARGSTPGKAGEKVLEVGCFDGYLLTKLQENGWDVYGCDPAGQTSLAVNVLGKGRIVNDFFNRETYPEKHFDVVIFRHLLEHLYDLHSFLDDIFYVLKDDGSVFIEVPNLYSTFDFGGFGSFFHQHISHFTIETLETLLRKHHFIIERSVETSVLHVQAQKIKTGNEARAVTPTVDMEAKRKRFLERYRDIEKKLRMIFDDPANQSIALFGASAGASATVNMFDALQRQKVKFIFDNDPSKHGKFIVGAEVPISAPETVKNADFDGIIICSYIFSDEIYQQLVDLGVEKNKIVFLEIKDAR